MEITKGTNRALAHSQGIAKSVSPGAIISPVRFSRERRL
jgi:hypothetical protein